MVRFANCINTACFVIKSASRTGKSGIIGRTVKLFAVSLNVEELNEDIISTSPICPINVRTGLRFLMRTASSIVMSVLKEDSKMKMISVTKESNRTGHLPSAHRYLFW